LEDIKIWWQEHIFRIRKSENDILEVGACQATFLGEDVLAHSLIQMRWLTPRQQFLELEKQLRGNAPSEGFA
jgi:hypothetical protein